MHKVSLIVAFFVYATQPASSFRIVDVSLKERIRHYLVDSEVYNEHQVASGPSSGFLSLCKEKQLTLPFPQFICPLMFLTSREQNLGMEFLYNNTAEAVAEINSMKNHECSHKNDSCILVFLPFDRILYGCLPAEAPIPQNRSDFSISFIVAHNLSTSSACVYSLEGQPVCSLDSVIVESYVLVEEHNCCCPSGYCATVLVDQPETVLPLIKLVVDLKEIDKTRTRKRRSIKEEKEQDEIEEFPDMTNFSTPAEVGTLWIIVFLAGMLACVLCVCNMIYEDFGLSEACNVYGAQQEAVIKAMNTRQKTSTEASPAVA